MCVYPGGNGAILSAGERWWPARQTGKETGSCHQTVEEVRCPKNVRRHGERARHGTKTPLCTECVSLCVLCAIICYNLDDCNREPYLNVSICFRRINHKAVKNHLHSSSGVREVVSGTILKPDIQWFAWCTFLLCTSYIFLSKIYVIYMQYCSELVFVKAVSFIKHFFSRWLLTDYRWKIFSLHLQISFFVIFVIHLSPQRRCPWIPPPG